jgi:hypothetical protein
MLLFVCISEDRLARCTSRPEDGRNSRLAQYTATQTDLIPTSTFKPLKLLEMPKVISGASRSINR